MDLLAASALSVEEYEERKTKRKLSKTSSESESRSSVEGDDSSIGSDEGNHHQHKKVIQSSKKMKWTTLEDSRLRSAITYFSDKLPDGKIKLSQTWGEIAQMVPNRTAKQCRERWCYNLDPTINHDPFTMEEDAILLKAQRQLRNQWAAIAKFLPGRTENAVKTRHTSILRAQRREWTAQEDQLILALYNKLGGKWDKMVPNFKNRTANAIKTRCSRLKKQSCSSQAVVMAQETLPIGHVRQIWQQPQLVDTIELNCLVRDTSERSEDLVVEEDKVQMQQPIISIVSGVEETLRQGMFLIKKAFAEDPILPVGDKLQLVGETNLLYEKYYVTKANCLLEQGAV